MGSMAKSKKLSKTRKRLKKALLKHAEVVGANAVTIKQVQRANAKLAAAVADYAEAVERKTGVPSPIVAGAYAGLDQSTIASLQAERDAISRSLTGEIAKVDPDVTAPPGTDEPAPADTENDSR